jgi:glycosyltransferase involved in cell wall biosynthesis
MKCTLIGPTYPYRGGISHYVTLLCEHLRQKHDVQFLSFKSQYPIFLFPGKTDKDPSSQPLRTDCDYLIAPLAPWTWLKTFWTVRSSQPDLVILQWWVPYWAPTFASIAYLVRRFTSIKILFICHNVVPHEEKKFDRLLAKLTLGQGHYFIVHSEKDLRDLRMLLPQANIRKVALPSNTALAQGRMAKAEAKAKLGLECNLILFFGFVRQYKGVVYLLQAMLKALRRVDVHLLIVGEFWDNIAPYTELIRELGIHHAVTIVDRYVPNEELGLYFSATDVVVLPYVDATQSAVVPLAYAFERPVITTRVGGLPDVVFDGETGILVPPGDSEALAQAIVRFFLSEPDKEWADAIARYQHKFSWERLVEVVESFVQPVRDIQESHECATFQAN